MIRPPRYILLVCLPAMAVHQPPAVAQGARVSTGDLFIGDGANTEQVYLKMIDWQVDRFTQIYDLTPQQQNQVRMKLNDLKTSHQVYASPLRGEFYRLAGEYRDLRTRQDNDQPFDRHRLEEVRRRIADLRLGSPWLNVERMRGEIESLLPLDQVEEGHLRLMEVERQREAKGLTNRVSSSDFSRLGSRIDPWNRYVERFIVRFQLTDPQAASARSVLRKIKEERDLYQKAHEKEFTEARRITDPAQRKQQLEKLYAPMDELFQRLKAQLEQLPTDAQRREAVARGLATQPAPETVILRPLVPSTQPTGPQ